jgi:hypothetical protein
MKLKAPKFKSNIDLGIVGFYEIQKCSHCPVSGLTIEKALLDGELPANPPSKQQIIGELYHSLMENVGSFSSREELKVFTHSKIAELENKYKPFFILNKWGKLSSWSEVTQSMRKSALKLGFRGSNILPNVEQFIKSVDGKFKGRPDCYYIDGTRCTIIDYKSSEIFKDSKVKTEYIEQLKFYASILSDLHPGLKEFLLKLVPLDGSDFELNCSIGEILNYKQSLVSCYESINSQLGRGELTNPSSENCQYCSYKAACHAFIQFQEKIKSNSNIYILEGVLESRNVGDDGVVELKINSGTVKLLHGIDIVEEVKIGNRYRIVNLNKKNTNYFTSITSQIYEV